MAVRSYENNQAAGRRFPGQMLLKPSSKMKQYIISYGKGRTLLRPWGDVLPTGETVPWRDSEGNFGTSWFVQDSIVQSWGKDFSFTAFLRCEDEHNWPTGSPLQLLYDEVKYSEQYKHLTERPKTGGFSVVSAPKHVGFLKGLLLGVNGKDHMSNPIWGAVAVIPPSAREAMDVLVNTANPTPGEPEENDPYGHNAKYLVGDPIGLKRGKIFEFDKESKITGVTPDEINLDGTSNTGSDGKVIEGYGVRIFPGKPVLALDHKVDNVRKHNETFEDCLWFMTGAEQIDGLLIRGFGRSHRDLLLYVFGNKGVLPQAYENARTTVDMGRTAAAKPAQAQQPRSHAAQAFEPNLDGDGEDGSQPWDDNGSDLGTEETPARSAADPVFTPPTSTAAPTAPAAAGGGMSTADAIRKKLAEAKQGK